MSNSRPCGSRATLLLVPCARTHAPRSTPDAVDARPRPHTHSSHLAPVRDIVEPEVKISKPPWIAGGLGSQPAQLICDDAQTPRVRRRKWTQECEGPRGWQTGAERGESVRTPAYPPGNQTPLHGRSQRQGTSRGAKLRICIVCEARTRRKGNRRRPRRARAKALQGCGEVIVLLASTVSLVPVPSCGCQNS
jgi:hypothetical protein